MEDRSEIVFSDEFALSVEANLGRDPMEIALDRGVPNAALVASQVKYLRRAERKIPSYHSARCILPPKSFEQASSEKAAARKNYSGRVAIDLTCGLGVDAFCLSHRFERVIAIERDTWLATVARENFRRLGIDNIEVACDSAENFLTSGALPTGIDLIYVDPDRRGNGRNVVIDRAPTVGRRPVEASHKGDNADGELADGSSPPRRCEVNCELKVATTGDKKMVRLEDCSPDISALLPLLGRITPRLVVKLSPLFDVDEVFRIFGADRGVFSTDTAAKPSVCVEVVSLGGECKEIIADVRFLAIDSLVPRGNTVRAVAIDLGEAEYPSRDDPRESDRVSRPRPFDPEGWRYLIIPDVALQKARIARRYFSERGVFIESDNGYGFATEKPKNAMGRTLEIESIEPFDPKGLKRRLKAMGIKNVDILRREFPLSATDIGRSLGVSQGGVVGIAFTRMADRLWQIFLSSR